MAYIIGMLSPREAAELSQRGWKLEDPPKGLRSPNKDGDRMWMVYVDNDMLSIMSGPDWELPKPK